MGSNRRCEMLNACPVERTLDCESESNHTDDEDRDDSFNDSNI
jgi:hypothetical protein